MRRFAPVFVAAFGLLLAAARWFVQGSQNVYTDASKRFYVPDPVLQWRLEEHGPLWLGLDALGIVGGLLVGSGAMIWLCRRWAGRGPRFAKLAGAAWIPATLAVVPALWAFGSGGRPAGAEETRPASVIDVPEGLHGGLPGFDAGRYEGRPEVDSVVAAVNAGGEVFDARFGVAEAWVVGDPSDLRQPLRAEVAIDATSIDTGVDGRSRHAGEYLLSTEHPQIRVRLAALTAAGAEPGGATFVANGELDFAGETNPVEITGRLRRGADDAHFVVDASFVVRIDQTPLKAHRSDFGADTIPIRILLPFEKTP